MILLPYGHEQTTVRRWPTVTLTLMGLCLAAFLISGRADPTPHEDRAIEQEVSEALEYYLERPYLELDATFRETFLSGTGPGDTAEMPGILTDAPL